MPKAARTALIVQAAVIASVRSRLGRGTAAGPASRRRSRLARRHAAAVVDHPGHDLRGAQQRRQVVVVADRGHRLGQPPGARGELGPDRGHPRLGRVQQRTAAVQRVGGAADQAGPLELRQRAGQRLRQHPQLPAELAGRDRPLRHDPPEHRDMGQRQVAAPLGPGPRVERRHGLPKRRRLLRRHRGSTHVLTIRPRGAWRARKPDAVWPRGGRAQGPVAC